MGLRHTYKRCRRSLYPFPVSRSMNGTAKTCVHWRIWRNSMWRPSGDRGSCRKGWNVLYKRITNSRKINTFDEWRQRPGKSALQFERGNAYEKNSSYVDVCHTGIVSVSNADEDIHVGDEVIVWYTGFIEKTDPAQIDAYKISKYTDNM